MQCIHPCPTLHPVEVATLSAAADIIKVDPGGGRASQVDVLEVDPDA